MNLSRAVDMWMGELARGGRAEGTRASYERHLWKLIDQVEKSHGEARAKLVTTNDCRAFLDRWIGKAPSTVCTIHSALNGLFSWLYLEGEIEANPMVRIARPRRPRPEDLDVVSVTPGEVEKMPGACRNWQEFLCLSVLAYLGVRRGSAVSCAGVTSILSRARFASERRAARCRSSQCRGNSSKFSERRWSRTRSHAAAMTT